MYDPTNNMFHSFGNLEWAKISSVKGEFSGQKGLEGGNTSACSGSVDALHPSSSCEETPSDELYTSNSVGLCLVLLDLSYCTFCHNTCQHSVVSAFITSNPESAFQFFNKPHCESRSCKVLAECDQTCSTRLINCIFMHLCSYKFFFWPWPELYC